MSWSRGDKVGIPMALTGVALLVAPIVEVLVEVLTRIPQAPWQAQAGVGGFLLMLAGIAVCSWLDRS